MANQISLENIVFENARKFHECYLLKKQQNDLQEAIENYAEVLSINPEHSQCYYRLASLMYESGQITLESTIEQCQKAIRMNPKNIDAYIYTGYYLELAENYNDAEAIFKKAIKLTRFKSARARLILASTIKNKIQNDKFNVLGKFRYIYYLITGGLTLVTDFSSLKMIYKNLTNKITFNFYKKVGLILEKINSKNVLDFYKSSIKKTQYSEYFYNKIAEYYLNHNDLEHGMKTYKKILEINPNSKETLLNLAKLTQIYYPEKINEVIDYYTLILETENDNLDSIYYELGQLYLQKNDVINAVAAFKLALKNNEDNPYYNDALAYAYVQAELFDDAIEYYQKTIKLNPDRLWTVNVCHTLGLIYQNCKENYEAAIASFQAGAILDPENEDILISLGNAYMEMNEIDMAIKTYKDVLLKNPENSEAYSKLGIVLWDKKSIQEAIWAYSKALEYNPKNESAYNNLGIVYYEELKDYDIALECFENAIKINPNYTIAYFNKGRLYQDLGNVSKAAKNYQMAADLNRITKSIDNNEIQNKLFELFYN